MILHATINAFAGLKVHLTIELRSS